MHPVEVIEATLGLDDNTIRRYWEGYFDKGIETYLSDHYVPNSGKLTEEQETLLSNHLEDHLYQDFKPIIKLARQEFRVTYSISRMRDLLHRLGFVNKQTRAAPSQVEK